MCRGLPAVPCFVADPLVRFLPLPRRGPVCSPRPPVPPAQACAVVAGLAAPHRPPFDGAARPRASPSNRPSPGRPPARPARSRLGRPSPASPRETPACPLLFSTPAVPCARPARPPSPMQNVVVAGPARPPRLRRMPGALRQPKRAARSPELAPVSKPQPKVPRVDGKAPSSCGLRTVRADVALVPAGLGVLERVEHWLPRPPGLLERVESWPHDLGAPRTGGALSLAFRRLLKGPELWLTLAPAAPGLLKAIDPAALGFFPRRPAVVAAAAKTFSVRPAVVTASGGTRTGVACAASSQGQSLTKHRASGYAVAGVSDCLPDFMRKYTSCAHGSRQRVTFDGGPFWGFRWR